MTVPGFPTPIAVLLILIVIRQNIKWLTDDELDILQSIGIVLYGVVIKNKLL